MVYYSSPRSAIGMATVLLTSMSDFLVFFSKRGNWRLIALAKSSNCLSRSTSAYIMTQPYHSGAQLSSFHSSAPWQILHDPFFFIVLVIFLLHTKWLVNWSWLHSDCRDKKQLILLYTNKLQPHVSFLPFSYNLNVLIGPQNTNQAWIFLLSALHFPPLINAIPLKSSPLPSSQLVKANITTTSVLA